MQVLKNFLVTYVNCRNFFIVTFGVMLIVFILWCFFARAGSARRCLKRINRILREEMGSDIIQKIEALRLNKRFARMWDDYYTAYSGEDTVALHNYLLKDDLLIRTSVFRTASRALPVGETINLIPLFFALAAVQAVFEVLYAAMTAYSRRRMVYLLEEFRMLSLRKLPGKAVDFSQQYLMEKLNETQARIHAVRSGVAQLNARMDRLIRTTEKNEEEQTPEE